MGQDLERLGSIMIAIAFPRLQLLGPLANLPRPVVRKEVKASVGGSVQQKSFP
jgi:hypothetical protein